MGQVMQNKSKLETLVKQLQAKLLEVRLVQIEAIQGLRANAGTEIGDCPQEDKAPIRCKYNKDEFSEPFSQKNSWPHGAD